MKILIVGAGEQGYVLTWALAKHPAVTKIVLADCDEDRASEVGRRVGGSKTTAVRLDARDVEAVAANADGAALLLNAVLPEWDLPLMEAALRARTHYLDMASRKPDGACDEGIEMQLALDGQFKAVKRTALMNTGLTAGVTNTLAAIGYEDLNHCEEIRIRATSIFSSEVPLQLWSQETYYIDSQTPSLYYADGAFHRAAPFEGREYYDFPEPWGRRPVVFHEHEEPSTLPRFLPSYGDKGLKYVDFKMGSSDEQLARLQAIVDSGMASPVPVTVRGGTVRPIDVLCAQMGPQPSRDEIAALAKAGKITDKGVYVVDLHREAGHPPAEAFFIYPPDMQGVTERIPGANRVSYGTSVAAATYAEFLAGGMITQTGVLPPEGLGRGVRLAYVDELKRRDIAIARRSERWL